MKSFAYNQSHDIQITYEKHDLNGVLYYPISAQGMVIFAHGSGSGRLSPRNQFVADFFHAANIATLLFDLLTPEEELIDEKNRQYRFNIHFLAERLVAVTKWLQKQAHLPQLSIGYFGASTGAGAALVAAAHLSELIKAVVSRGGRPDLADEALSYVNSPTLLIAGSLDETVIELNQKAVHKLRCIKKLVIVNGATHLFEEPGKLEEVAKLSVTWFKKYL